MEDKTSNPWTTNGSRPVYENSWIAVREDAVTRPDGQPGIYGVVHFKNQAVGVVPIDSDGAITLVGQYRYTLDLYSWEIPEGGSPAGEDPLSTAQRELLEETGLTAAKWTLLQTAHLSNSVSDEIAFCYLAEDLTPGPPNPEGCERIETMRVPFAAALRMVEAGEITDALSVMGILRYALVRAVQV